MKRSKAARATKNCDRCRGRLEDRPKPATHLVPTQRSKGTALMAVRLCRECQELFQAMNFTNVLGRNAATDELRKMAARLPNSRAFRSDNGATLHTMASSKIRLPKEIQSQ